MTVSLCTTARLLALPKPSDIYHLCGEDLRREPTISSRVETTVYAALTVIQLAFVFLRCAVI